MKDDANNSHINIDDIIIMEHGATMPYSEVKKYNIRIKRYTTNDEIESFLKENQVIRKDEVHIEERNTIMLRLYLENLPEIYYCSITN